MRHHDLSEKEQEENPPLGQGCPAAPALPLPGFRARQASLVQPGRPSPPPSLTPLPPFNLSLRSGDRARSDRTDSISKTEGFSITAQTTRPDVYARITADIVAQLEAGVRPWHQPWNAAHAAGGITRPLRNNGKPYQGVNVLVLWLTAFQKGYACPIWMRIA
jgi:hypothetical protein